MSATNAEIVFGSVQYLKVTVRGDITLDQQEVTVILADPGVRPDVADEQAATWVGTAGTTRVCQVLIGTPGGYDVQPGEYEVYVRIFDNPEIPLIPAGMVTVK